MSSLMHVICEFILCFELLSAAYTYAKMDLQNYAKIESC